MALNHSHRAGVVSEVLFPPAYTTDSGVVSLGSPYTSPPAGHHHHLVPYVQHGEGPVAVPRMSGGIQSLPGVYLEPTIEEPVALPGNGDWTPVDTSANASPADAALLIAVKAVYGACKAVVRARWHCVEGTELLRATAADANAAPRYLFGRPSSDGSYAIVGDKAYTEHGTDGLGVVPMPPPMPQVVGGFFDKLTSDGKRGWGYTLAATTRTPAAVDVFRKPNLCFVYGGSQVEARVATRKVRVIGTPAAGALLVEVVGISPGDDRMPTVTASVGKDLTLGAVAQPFVVRVIGVPVDASVAFQGLDVTIQAAN